jgi:hypothetical protein
LVLPELRVGRSIEPLAPLAASPILATASSAVASSSSSPDSADEVVSLVPGMSARTAAAATGATTGAPTELSVSRGGGEGAIIAVRPALATGTTITEENNINIPSDEGTGGRSSSSSNNNSGPSAPLSPLPLSSPVNVLLTRPSGTNLLLPQQMANTTMRPSVSAAANAQPTVSHENGLDAEFSEVATPGPNDMNDIDGNEKRHSHSQGPNGIVTGVNGLGARRGSRVAVIPSAIAEVSKSAMMDSVSNRGDQARAAPVMVAPVSPAVSPMLSPSPALQPSSALASPSGFGPLPSPSSPMMPSPLPSPLLSPLSVPALSLPLDPLPGVGHILAPHSHREGDGTSRDLALTSPPPQIAGDAKTQQAHSATMKHLADQSMVAFLSTIREVALTQELAHWRHNEHLCAMLPSSASSSSPSPGSAPAPHYEVDMGFGLHVGWAIEGAIGSVHKIDASYLSPNVNIASRLCGATKQYGVRLLLSGPLHSLLQPEIRARCRLLDRITVKGSKEPLSVFTFDVGPLALRGGGAGGGATSPSLQLQQQHQPSSSPVAGAGDGVGAGIVAGSAAPTIAAPLPPQHHVVDFPRSSAISLASVAARTPGTGSVAGDADIEVDDQGHVLPATADSSRVKNLSLEEQAARIAARNERRTSGGLANGRKIVDAVAAAVGLKKEPAPAGTFVSGGSRGGSQRGSGISAQPAPQQQQQQNHTHHPGSSNRVAPEELLYAGEQKAASATDHPSSPSSLEMQKLRPAHASSAAPPSSTPLSPSSNGGKAKPKVEHGDFTPATLASICAQLQLGLPEDFVRTFNEASSLYIKGKWGRAREVLEQRVLKMAPEDKPAKVLLGIMKEHKFKAPEKWPGYRALTSK